ncbi:MAG TPA: serpin family protein [Fimbriimonadaceae bacterium]|nr:serpin family protein [Fimbriimonadaceae bacterium]
MRRAGLLILPFLAIACNIGPEFPLPEPSTDRLPNKKDAANYEPLNRFAFQYADQIKLGSSHNDLVSPLSVGHNLCILLNATSGSPRSQLLTLFGQSESSLDEFNESQRALLNSLRNDDGAPLKTANSLWSIWPMVMDKAFGGDMAAEYDAVVRKLGGTGVEATRLVNEWAKERTGGQITHVLDELTRKSVILVVSAASFDDEWQTPFDPKNTKNARFHTPGGEITAPMMSLTGDFDYWKGDVASAVEIPYKKGQYSMILILPAEGKSIDDVRDWLTFENWNAMLGGFSTQDVALSLPKFSCDRRYDLIDTVADLGVPDLFTSKCNMRPVSVELERGYSISIMTHMTKITVDERGTTAASAGASVATTAAAQVGFAADRPFMYAIVEKRTGVIAFLGALVDPSEAQ